MRDFNTSGDHYGDIHVNERRDHVVYAEASTADLEEERTRLVARLRETRRGRYLPFSIGFFVGLALVVAGLWWINNLTPSVVSLVGIAAGVLSCYFTYQQWGRPSSSEEDLVDGILTIGQVLEYRKPPRSSRKKK